MDDTMLETDRTGPPHARTRRRSRRRWAVLAAAAGMATMWPAAAQAQTAPAPSRCSALDFDKAVVQPLVSTSTAGRNRLTVTGTKPWLDIQVRLVPLDYIQQPEYWGIQVIGCHPGDIGLPAQGPYTATYDFTGTLGTRGIEVIGATRRQTIDLTRPVPRPDPRPNPGALIGTDWVLDPTSLGVPLPPGATINAKFSATNVGGRSACNIYSASYEVLPGNRIFIGAPITTKIACSPEINQAEATYLRKLQSSRGYRLAAGQLILTGPAGSLRFRSEAPAAPALVGSWNVTGVLGDGGAVVPVAPGTAISLTINADGNLGGEACNVYSAPWKADGSSLSIGDITSTLRLCAEPVGSQESRYFAALKSAASWRVEGNRLVLADGSGGDVIVATRSA